jgi:hypothetical protein
MACTHLYTDSGIFGIHGSATPQSAPSLVLVLGRELAALAGPWDEGGVSEYFYREGDTDTRLLFRRGESTTAGNFAGQEPTQVFNDDEFGNTLDSLRGPGQTITGRRDGGNGVVAFACMTRFAWSLGGCRPVVEAYS